ncbi:MAG: tandem-95 repeat protein, partial [Cyanobacteria bacterium J06649_4]
SSANGAVSIDNNGTPSNANDDLLVYTPNAGFSGIDSFDYSISDGAGQTETATVSVTVEAAPPPPPPPAEPGNRVSEGLLSLYTFDEGSGNTVFDVSGNGSGLNLTINNPNNVTWGDGTLSLDAPSLIASTGPASKLYDGITNTQEITIEAWITSDNTTQSGPARIATLSSNSSRRNFTLGQQRNEYHARLRTSSTGLNGTGRIVASTGSAVSTELTHVVYTREADGDAFLYVDNALVRSNQIGGDLSNWDASYRFALGSELSGGRAWRGDYDLVAIYNQAFDANEVAQNYAAGADGDSTAPPPPEPPPSPSNTAPIANDDSATTAEDNAVTLSVLENDTDADGDVLSIASVAGVSQGTAQIVGDAILYTPSTNFAGIEQLTYTISDGNGGTATANATITVNGVNDAPVAVDDVVSTAANSAVTVDVLANDSDVEGDPLTVSSVSAPGNGTAAIVGTQVEYQPAAGFSGEDSFTYTVADGNGGTSTGTVSISVASQPPPPPEPGNRVSEGLLSLYTFDEGSGSTVFDVSGVGTALNLEIDNVNSVSWGDGVLNIDSPTLISSAQAAQKLNSGIQATQEITIEAWVAADNLTQSGPARIVTLSRNASQRNFTLGQRRDEYSARLRTTTTGGNGARKRVVTNQDSVDLSPAHVVYTRDAAGSARLYVDSILVKEETIDGDFSNWNNDYQLALGDELNGGRSWLGTLELVAVYNQALDMGEVEQNFLVGSDLFAG